MPPSLREWLAGDHLAWFVIGVVDGLDLAPFLAGYRQDGWGRAAHDPAMVVALIVYAYAIGERSSRRIERRCREDVAFRVITANQAPDHATIARFRVRHERALGQLFGQVLGLCADAGLVRVGVVAVDGTKVQANACEHATRDYEQIAREILEQAAEIDALEDEHFGERRGDELPRAVATREGRQRWLRDAQRRLEQRRVEQARPIPRSRAKRLLEARRRLEEELEVERRANAEYEAYRARGVMKNGRRFGSPPKPYRPPERPAGKINLTDLDSRNVKTLRGWVQGYNAQAVCTEDQIVIAADVIISSADFGQLEPMVQATEGTVGALVRANHGWRERLSVNGLPSVARSVPTWCRCPARGARRRLDHRDLRDRGAAAAAPVHAAGAALRARGGAPRRRRRGLERRPHARVLHRAPRPAAG